MDGLELHLLLDHSVYASASVCHDHDLETHCDPMWGQEGAPPQPLPGRGLGVPLLHYELDSGHGKEYRLNLSNLFVLKFRSVLGAATNNMVQ